MIVNLSFENFMRILNDNRGKPIYRKNDVESKFQLYWTSVPFSGFYYYCEVPFDDIYLSYMRQFNDWNPEKAIDLFVNTYLLNCIQMDTKTKEIKLGGMPLITTPPYAKESSPTSHIAQWEISELKPVKEFDISTFKLVKENASKKRIEGRNKTTGKIEIYAVLKRKKVKASDVSFVKQGSPETRQAIFDGTSYVPTDPLARIPDEPYTYPGGIVETESEMEQNEEPKTFKERIKKHYSIIKEDTGLLLIQDQEGNYKIIDKETGKEINEESEKPLTNEDIEKKVEEELKAYQSPTEQQKQWIRRKVKKRKPHGVLEFLEGSKDVKKISKK
jgi:hypothetical protein